MILIDKKYIGQIPMLEICKDVHKNEPLPVVVYFHGFTSAKEENLSQAYYLAEEGYRVILPEALHHGERATTEDPYKIQFDFWKIVFSNVEELHMIKNFLNENKLLLNERIGIAGTSMGGITVAAALTKYDWIKVAGIMMGTAKLVDMNQYLINEMERQGVQLPFTEEEIHAQVNMLKTIDLSNQIEKLNHRPLFIWHGDKDLVVPYKLTEQFVRQLKEYNYPDEQFKFITDKGRDHKVSRQAKIQLKQWFLKYL